MVSIKELTKAEAELLDLLDDVAHGKNEQRRHDALLIISEMDSNSILKLLLLLRCTAKQQPVAKHNTGDDMACKLRLPLERCLSGAEHTLETEWSSLGMCRSPQQATTVDKAVHFNVGKNIQDLTTPRLGDLRESDQSPTAAIREAAATEQQAVVSSRLLAQLQRQECSAIDMGSLELMGQSIAVGRSIAELNLLQASHMELVPSSYGEQRADCTHAEHHSSAGSCSSEPTCSRGRTAQDADITASSAVEQAISTSSCSNNSSASFRQFQQLGESSMIAAHLQDVAAAPTADAAASSAAHASSAAAVPPPPPAMAAGPCASIAYAELEAPPCISSPYEPAPAGRPPAESNQARGSELRQSALSGPVHSFQLQLPADGEDEDTASELALSDVVTPTAPAASVAARSAALYSPASSSCRTPASSILDKGSALPAFSNSSPVSAVQHRTPAPMEQQQRHVAGSKPRGLGRVFGAIRRSLTGKQVKDEMAAASPAAATAARKCSEAAKAGSADSRAPAAAALAVQSRLPSFTQTERVRQQTIIGSGGSRPGGKRHAPSSTGGNSRSPCAAGANGYKPPGSAYSVSSGRIAAGEAAAAQHSKSPLGKATLSPASRAAGASKSTVTATGLVSRTLSSSGGGARTPIANSPSPYKSPAGQTATAAHPAASPTGSAGLAWLKQHSSDHESIKGGLRTAPVSPCTSRPASVASVRSVASAAPHVGAPSRIGAGTSGTTGSSQMPGFKVTKQMVDAKQQPGPPKQQRTPVNTPGNSARSAASKTSKASYMRQLSSPGDALAAAAAAVAASRSGVGRLAGNSDGGGGSCLAKQGLRAGPQMKSPTPPALAQFTATAGAAGAMHNGFTTAAVPAASPAAGISRQVVSRIGTGAAGRGGGSQLRRSRSCGSLADMLAQGVDKARDVSEVRKMWQQRAAEHGQQQLGQLYPRQQQRQLAAGPAVAAAAAPGQAVSLSSKAGLTRIPSLGGSRIPSAAGAAAVPAGPGLAEPAAAAASECVLHGPELTDSPPLSPVSREVCLSRSRCGRASDASGASDAVLPDFPAAAAAAAAGPDVGCSFAPGLKMQGFLQRMDDAICELQPGLPAEVQATPLAAPAGAAASAVPSTLASKLVLVGVAEGNTAAGEGYSGLSTLEKQLYGEQHDGALNRQLF